MQKTTYRSFSILSAPELWILVIAAATRLVPHPPNFTAVGAMALFAGATLRWPLAIALAAMVLSDTILGFHSLIPFVYGAFALSVGLGWLMRKKRGWMVWSATSVAGSLIFFFVTNFGVWLEGDLYSKTWGGWLECLSLALPFFRNTLAGDLFYSGVLFGSLKLAQLLVRAPVQDRYSKPIV